MAQEYPSQGADFMKMAPGEQDMVDVHQQQQPDREGGKKKSVVGKVKDKAKKLKSKIKGSGKKRTDELGNEVDHSSSSGEEEEEETPKEPGYQTGARGFEGSEEARKDGVVHGGEQGESRDLPQKKESTDLPPKKDESSDLPPEKDETSGLQDQLRNLRVGEDPAAPAAGADWYAQPPSSDETRKRQDEVPSTLGQESAGVSSGIDSSGLGSDDKKSEDRSGFPGFHDKKSDEPSGFLGSGAENKDNERDVAAGDLPSAGLDEKISEGITKPRSGDDEKLTPVSEGVDNSGRDLTSAEVTDQSPKVDDMGSGAATGEFGAVNKELKPSGSQKGWMQRASEGVASVKNALLGSPKSTPEQASSGVADPEQQKTLSEKARDAAVSAKDTVSSKLPSSTAPRDVPASEQQTSGVAQKTEEKSAGVAAQALEAATGLRDTVAAKLGYANQSPTGNEVDSSAAPTESARTADASKTGVTQRVTELKDTVASKLGYGAGAGATGTAPGATTTAADDKTGSKLFTPDEHDQALSEKITNMLTLGGSKPGSNTSTTEPQAADATGESTATPQSKGVYDRVTGAVGSLLGKKTDEKPVTGSAEASPVSTEPEH